jgi:hypothetical protein
MYPILPRDASGAEAIESQTLALRSLHHLTLTVTDDRDRRWGIRHIARTERERKSAVGRALGRAGILYHIAGIAVVLFAVGQALGLQLAGTRIPGSPGPGAMLLVLAALLGIHVFLAVLLPRISARSRMVLQLRERICPMCGYDLARIEAQADGCIVCPECSAAWASTRVGPADSA